MFQVNILKSKTETTKGLFGKFCLEPLTKGQGITIGNALRRILLSNLTGAAITGVRIENVNHEFSTIPNIKEDVIEILLNFKQLILKGSLSDEPLMARLIYKGGMGLITAADIEISGNLTVVEPRQHIAFVTGQTSLEIELIIEKGQGYNLGGKTVNRLPEGFLEIDAVFMPVRKVNFFVETCRNSLDLEIERLVFEIYTDGSILPMDALISGAKILEQLFSSIKISETEEKFVSGTETPKLGDPQELELVTIEELELSVRAYNCLKRADIHTINDLFKYSQEDLLEFKNFGQKSADEVNENLKLRFGKSLLK
jgi:DNA-directed RNA polymerase subunit alpha